MEAIAQERGRDEERNAYAPPLERAVPKSCASAMKVFCWVFDPSGSWVAYVVLRSPSSGLMGFMFHFCLMGLR